MRARDHTKQLALTGIFVSLGLILPYCTAHAFGLPGNIFLPMHIPVLLCGLLCGPRYGILCGLATPLLSSILLSMPVLYPMLPIMGLQLMTLGFLSGLLYQRVRLPLYLALPLSMLASWCVYGFAFAALLFGGGTPLRAPSVLTAIVNGIPGSILQILLIPVILLAFKRYRLLPLAPPVKPRDALLCEAKELIAQGTYSCVVIQAAQIVYKGNGRGVSPLIQLYQNHLALLAGSIVVDKIIGKAAAMILVLGGASKVHGETMSVAAKDYLTQHGIAVSYERLIDVIANRTRDGICAIERSVLDLEDPEEGLSRIQDTIKVLMASG